MDRLPQLSCPNGGTTPIRPRTASSMPLPAERANGIQGAGATRPFFNVRRSRDNRPIRSAAFSSHSRTCSRRLPRAVLSRGSRDCRMQSTSKFAVLRASRNGKTALHGSNGSRPGPRRELTNSSYSLNTPSSSASSTGVSALAVSVDSAGEFCPDGLSLVDSEVGFRCFSPEFSPLVVLICA